VDSFVSQAGYEDLLREFRQEYEALDLRCDAVRQSEKEIGAFTACGGSVFRADA
jgi:hypothetical protein